MSNRILTFISIASIFLGSFIGCRQEAREVETPSKSMLAKVSTANRMEIPETYHFTGSVRGDQRINLSTKVMGQITQMDVDEGDFVRKNQIIARIKQDQILAQKNQVVANLKQAKAALQNVETNYKRIKALYEDKSATQKEFDDIKTQYDVAQAKVDALNGKLQEVQDLMNYTEIRSPVDAYVIQKMAEVGDMASPGRPILTVENVHYFKVKASVPEAQIELFHKGDSVAVHVKAASAEPIPGVVSSVNPSGDARSRQFTVEIRLNPRDDKLVKSGMYAQIVLEKGKRSVISVPKNALVHRGQLTGLYTLNEDNEAYLRWVRTGRTLNSQVEILSGLKAGERYIANWEGRVTEGQKIAIQ